MEPRRYVQSSKLHQCGTCRSGRGDGTELLTVLFTVYCLEEDRLQYRVQGGPTSLPPKRGRRRLARLLGSGEEASMTVPYMRSEGRVQGAEEAGR